MIVLILSVLIIAFNILSVREFEIYFIIKFLLSKNINNTPLFYGIIYFIISNILAFILIKYKKVNLIYLTYNILLFVIWFYLFFDKSLVCSK